jgi:hypothetical protein
VEAVKMLEIACTYCGESDYEPLGPGDLLREHAPLVNRIEIGDHDTIYRCRNRLCGGMFGANRIRCYPVKEGKMGLNTALFTI